MGFEKKLQKAIDEFIKNKESTFADHKKNGLVIATVDDLAQQCAKQFTGDAIESFRYPRCGTASGYVVYSMRSRTDKVITPVAYECLQKKCGLLILGPPELHVFYGYARVGHTKHAGFTLQEYCNICTGLLHQRHARRLKELL